VGTNHAVKPTRRREVVSPLAGISSGQGTPRGLPVFSRHNLSESGRGAGGQANGRQRELSRRNESTESFDMRSVTRSVSMLSTVSTGIASGRAPK
jgi:hypothetical protein